MDIPQKEKDNILKWDGRSRGFYEVYYLKWNDPKSNTAAWIRYTLTSPTMEAVTPYCELWGIFFDVDDPSKNFAVKNRFPIYDLSWEKDKFNVSIGDAFLRQDACKGTIESNGQSLSWDLAISSDQDTYRYFPSEFFYKGAFPKTKGLSPHVNARFEGTLTANGRKIEFSGAPGQQTHLWGVKHSLRWAWGHCNLFNEDTDALWEGLDGKVKLGPFDSPQFVFGYLRLNGEDHMFNSPASWIKNSSSWKLGRWEFEMKNKQIAIKGLIDCDYDEMVAVTYTDPDGELLWCNNSKVASLRLHVFDKSGERLAELTSDHGCAAEFVDRITYPEVPVRI